MQATLEQLSQIKLFATLDHSEIESLQPHTEVHSYQKGETIISEGDHLPPQLYSLLGDPLRVSKIAMTGKETILRTLTNGEIFAAPAWVGNGISPATVIAQGTCLVITVKRDALLKTIQAKPEIALRILAVFNDRLQQLHETVHGLVSQRAIVRLARLIDYFALQYGTKLTREGRQELNTKLPHYRLARSIGISYEECARLVKSLNGVITYHRGGKITILDLEQLNAIATGDN